MAGYLRGKAAAKAGPGQIARGLGWLSVGIGVAQVLAPRTVSRLCGVPVPPKLMMLCGLREIACGVGLLTQEQPAPWIKVRVAGDAADLAALGCGAMVAGSERRRIAVAAAAVGAVTLVDLWCGRELAINGRSLTPRQETLSIEIDCDAATLYRFWRELSNLPLVMPHVRSVQEIDETHSHWTTVGAGGARLEWDAEIIDDEPDVRIAWRSVEGSAVFNAGSVQFQPLAERSTRVRVDLLYEQPPATFASAMAALFGLDLHRESADLAALKVLLERGESHDNPRLIA